MSKNFNLHFSDDEEGLLAEGKKKHGSNLGRFFKNALRVDLTMTYPEDEDDVFYNQEYIAYLVEVCVGDIAGIGFGRWHTGVENLRDTMKRRLRDMKIKHPKEYGEVEYQLRKQYPELEKYL